MKKIKKTPVALAVGAAVASTFTATAANAEANPFGMSELSSGYMQMAESDKAGEMNCGASMGKKEGTCGEGKCGDKMMGETKVKEGKCAGNKTVPKAKEGECGAMMDGDQMKKGTEGQCGEMMKGMKGMEGAGSMSKDTSAEGMCGEGKCGGMMDGGMMKKGMEGQCGEMMKGKEGACGDNKAGETKSSGGGWPIRR